MDKNEFRRGLLMFLERAYFLDHNQRTQFINNLEGLIRKTVREETGRIIRETVRDEIMRERKNLEIIGEGANHG